MEDILAIVFLFGGGAVFLFAISPIGRAIADRIRRTAPELSEGEVGQLRESQLAIAEELDALRQELGDVQERLDFAERLLLRHRDAEALPPGPAGGGQGDVPD